MRAPDPAPGPPSGTRSDAPLRRYAVRRWCLRQVRCLSQIGGYRVWCIRVCGLPHPRLRVAASAPAGCRIRACGLPRLGVAAFCSPERYREWSAVCRATPASACLHAAYEGSWPCTLTRGAQPVEEGGLRQDAGGDSGGRSGGDAGGDAGAERMALAMQSMQQMLCERGFNWSLHEIQSVERIALRMQPRALAGPAEGSCRPSRGLLQAQPRALAGPTSRDCSRSLIRHGVGDEDGRSCFQEQDRRCKERGSSCCRAFTPSLAWGVSGSVPWRCGYCSRARCRVRLGNALVPSQ